MARKASWTSVILGISREILRNRASRRSFILYVIGAVLVMMVLGYWPMAGWLDDSPVRFLLWWGACGLLAVFLFLLGVYDFLRVLRENDPKGL